MGFTLFREKINPNAEKATQLLNTCTTSRYKLQMREREMEAYNFNRRGTVEH
jgi:hypothetical protein